MALARDRARKQGNLIARGNTVVAIAGPMPMRGAYRAAQRAAMRESPNLSAILKF
jgi:hypothetical protein